jgi:Extensin-like protein C-terminus
MKRGPTVYVVVGAGVLVALAGCGRGFMSGERAAWRHQAEVECMKSGAVKLGAGIVQIDPIEGPGMCGADFPLKVAALGESSPAISYADDPRPPGSVPGAAAQMPRWPINEPQYAPPGATAPMQTAPTVAPAIQAPQMRWVPGPPPAQRSYPNAPASQPASLSARGTEPGITPGGAPLPDDIPDDAILPPGRGPTYTPQRTYNAPVYQPSQRDQRPPVYQTPQRAPPALGPARGNQMTAPVTPAALNPPATLACPLVSALDQWVSDSVQPAAIRWLGSPVAEIKQISAYSCRGMVGSGGSGISEHAFGNAIDIAAFTLADGRRVTVQDGWHGSPEEQGFLRDVHLAACNHFTTVLAPGYNAAHYNHIHVDLMRRASGDRPCRPEAISGEVAAAKARTVYAGRQRGPAFTSALRANAKVSHVPAAIPGEDGYLLDDVMIDLQSRRGATRGSIDDDVTGGSSRAVSKTAKSGEDRFSVR